MSKHATFRAQVYWCLERPDREAERPRLLEIALILLITTNVTAVVLETVDTIYAVWQPAFDVFERISLTIFIIEYAARLWVVPENPHNRSRRVWVVTPSAIIDLLAILPALLVLLFPIDLRILRTFRIVRLFKLTRYSPALGMLLSVFEEEAGAFFAGFFILIVMLVLAASGTWLVEHQVQPDAIGSIPAAMWWAVATLTTVSYGDVSPVTIAGKVFGAIITVLGIGMAALTAGVLASGLSDQLHRRRSSMQAQFLSALEDGFICDAEKTQIEDLRKSLGLSHRAALQIRREVEAEVHARMHLCPSCGHSLSDLKEAIA